MARHYVDPDHNVSNAVCALEKQVAEQHSHITDLTHENQQLKAHVEYYMRERTRLEQELLEARKLV